MTIKITDARTEALVRELAERLGVDEQQAVAQAAQKSLRTLEVAGDSYRERRNARIRARELFDDSAA